MISPPTRLVPPLLDWYARSARDLPWRRSPTGYHVLLSELLCQQTRIETALPYFHAFVDRWPTIEALAAAPVEDVLHAWAGLGYYRRARALHAAAVAAVEGGGLPRTAEGLRALPGVGPYTAGAVAAIAFGEREAAVDGNVERVLSRLDRGPEAPWSAAGKRTLQARAKALHHGLPDGASPGDLVQALMELGATVCTPRPRCGDCPLRDACASHAEGDVADWPRSRPRKPPTPFFATFTWIEGPDGVVMGRRREGLLGGLWEPLRIDHGPSRPTDATLAEAVQGSSGLAVALGPELGTVQHVFSHRHLTAHVRPAGLLSGSLVPGGPYDALTFTAAPEALALSALARKVIDLSRPGQLPLLAAEPSQISR